MLSFTIDKTDFVRGMSITTRHDNGGFAPYQSGVNLEKTQGGILLPQPAVLDLDAENSDIVLDNMVAFAADPSFLGNEGYALDEDGNYYTIDGTTVTKVQTDSGGSYNVGTTDFIVFQGAAYATTTTDIVKLTGSDLGTMDDDWWTNTEGKTALSSSYRHVMEVVEDTLFIADRYRLHTYDGTTSVYAAMSLPQDYNITAMVKHVDGRHLVVFVSQTANFSHTRRSDARCFIVDTVNLEFIQEIKIDAQVEGTIEVGGVIYVTYGDNLGFFDGAGLRFLRKLKNSSTIYKPGLAKKEDILLIADGEAVLAFGDLGLGQVFWYPVVADVSISAIFHYGDNKIVTSSADSDHYLELWDLDNNDGASTWETNYYSFPGKAWIRKIVVETETLASGSDMTFYSVDKNDTATEIFDITYASDGAIDEVQVFPNVYTDLFKLRIAFAAGNPSGVIKVTVFYEDGE